MRRGFILAVLGLGALALVVAKVVLPTKELASQAVSGPATADESAPRPAIPAAGESNGVRRLKMAPSLGTQSSDSKGENSAIDDHVDRHSAEQAEQREARVAARVVELGELARRTDRASLETLLSEVRNPDAEIRQAALDAITQSGNRAAIPGLREAAAQTQDVAAKEAIDEVIEFMSLPTLTEVLRGPSTTNSPRPTVE